MLERFCQFCIDKAKAEATQLATTAHHTYSGHRAANSYHRPARHTFPPATICGLRFHTKVVATDAHVLSTRLTALSLLPCV